MEAIAGPKHIERLLRRKEKESKDLSEVEVKEVKKEGVTGTIRRFVSRSKERVE